METTKQYFKVDGKQISFLKFLLEAYDGIANLTTLNPKLGHIVINIAPGCEEDVKTLLWEIKDDVVMEQIKNDESEENSH